MEPNFAKFSIVLLGSFACSFASPSQAQIETYGDFSMMFHRWGEEYGTSGPWGYVDWIPVDSTHTNAQFYAADGQTFLSTEYYTLNPSDGWVYQNGYSDANGNRWDVSVIAETLSTPSGQTDLTVPGGPEHYAMWYVPSYTYSVWTHAYLVNRATGARSEFSYSVTWDPPSNVFDAYWLGDSQKTRRAITQHEQWWDASDGTWALRTDRTAHSAKNTGSIWAVHDNIGGSDYGLIYTWTF